MTDANAYGAVFLSRAGRLERSGAGLCLALLLGCVDASDTAARVADSAGASSAGAGVNAGGLGESAGAGGSAEVSAANGGDAGNPNETPPPSSFTPCPEPGAACAIMPFGDSITEGFPSFDGGYRVELFHEARLGSHRITFVGDRANGPQTVDGEIFPRGSEGYSGYTIDASVRSGITARAEPAIRTYRPHIILLMIGTNDIDLDLDVAGAPARLGALIDRITAAAPDALLAVATILPTTNAVTNERFQAYNAAIPGLVESRSAAGQHVIGVDAYAAFTAYPNYASDFMVDALHPSAMGYAVLGQIWYTAILPYLR